MNLLTYIKTLSYGVLNNTKYGEIGDVTVAGNVLPLVTLIDEGLTRLYSRFCLRERHLVLEMQVGVTFYHFDKKYSVQNNDPILVPHPYIMDLPHDPFDEDVIKVLRVDDSAGVERPLDDKNDTTSVFMVQYDVLHNPYPKEGEVLFITYQAKQVPLFALDPESDDFTLREEFILPPVLEPALANYVAYLVYSRMGTSESMAKAAMHMAVYTQICDDAEAGDLVNSSKSGTNERFSLNGWE